MFPELKGWRTFLWNVGVLGLGTTVLAWAGDFNWVEYVGEVPAMWIVAIAGVALRSITNSPMFDKD